MDMKLEVIVLPVADVDRAKGFYEAMGFRLDADFSADGGFRVVQLTPPGSEASIIFGAGVTSAAPGSVQGLYLVVYDIEAAREDLIARGIDISEVYHDAGGLFEHAGPTTGYRDRIPTAGTTPPSRPSATPTATGGCFRKCGSARPAGDHSGRRALTRCDECADLRDHERPVYHRGRDAHRHHAEDNEAVPEQQIRRTEQRVH